MVGLLTGIPTFFEMYRGIDVGDFFGWFVGNSAWLLPVSCFVFGLAAGVAVGWQLRKQQVDAEAAKAEAASRMQKRLDAFEKDPFGEKKLLAVVVYGFPGHMARVDKDTEDEFRVINSNRAIDGKSFFVIDPRGADITYIKPERWLIELFDAHPELIDGFPAEGIEDCRKIIMESDPLKES